jgi:predicted O-methyltransferase YrrM
MKPLYIRMLPYFFRPWTLPKKIKNYVARKYFDKTPIELEQNLLFNAIHLSREFGLRRKADLATVLNGIDDSEHTTLFASLSENRKINKILEIGTYDGFNAHFLSILFSGAIIETIDLPDDDPIFMSSYGRDNLTFRLEFLEKRKQNVLRHNIIFKNLNSLWLLNYQSSVYDLIWVDGAHGYPVVAIDIANALRLVAKGGIVVCDDVWVGRPENESDSMYKSSATFCTLTAMKAAGIIEVNFIYKRTDFSSAGRADIKEYIAVIKKIENPESIVP